MTQSTSTDEDKKDETIEKLKKELKDAQEVEKIKIDIKE